MVSSKEEAGGEDTALFGRRRCHTADNVIGQSDNENGTPDNLTSYFNLQINMFTSCRCPSALKLHSTSVRTSISGGSVNLNIGLCIYAFEWDWDCKTTNV